MQEPRAHHGRGVFFCPLLESNAFLEATMAKGQQRSNREVKKPKKKKDAVADAPAPVLKGIPANLTTPKKAG